MPSTISRARLSKAFNEGRRSATEASAENPYDNPKLRRLWEQGRARQLAGELQTPLPPLAHGERRAERVPRNPPGSKPPPRPQPRRGGFDRGGFNRGGRGGPRGR